MVVYLGDLLHICGLKNAGLMENFEKNRASNKTTFSEDQYRGG